jgi:arabinose-5-phosphate isomerase
MVVSGDLVLGISASGETEEMVRLLELLKRIGVPLISLTGNLESTLARHSVVALDVSVPREAGPMGLVPTSSTAAALAMGDALAVALLEKKQFTARDFAAYHPGGRLGRELLLVRDMMHTGNAIPIVNAENSMMDAIRVMSAGKLGMTCVVGPDSMLAGVLTDGDLRRLLQTGMNFTTQTTRECMTRDPITISGTEPAARALHLMESRKITSLIVVSPEGRVEGVVHIHDLWRTQLF